jgi:hypothetical protein
MRQQRSCPPTILTGGEDAFTHPQCFFYPIQHPDDKSSLLFLLSKNFSRPIAVPQAQIRIQNNINCPWSNQVQKEVNYHPDFIPGYSYVGVYFSSTLYHVLSDTDLNLKLQITEST